MGWDLPDGIENWPREKQIEWRTEASKDAQQIWAHCNSYESSYDEEALSIDEWSSKSPIIHWLGFVNHLFWTLFSIVTVGVIWLFVFETNNEGK